MLNIIWAGFFVVAFGVGLTRMFVFSQPDVFAQMMKAMFEASRTGFEIALGLTGVMTLWIGILRIGEKGGFLQGLICVLTPFLRRIFPGVPEGHPALGSIVMNMAANMLGLDNAATPIGLKAMRELQELNPTEDTATNAQILFLVINASSITIFPVTIFTFRAQQGAADPTDVFIPILIATYCSTMGGLIATAIVQKINLWDRVVLVYLGAITALIGAIVYYFTRLSAPEMLRQSGIVSNFLLFSLIVIFICGASLRRVNVYEAFIEGAKEGFAVAISIIPYLIAMLVAIAAFRASGAMDFLLSGIKRAVHALGVDSRFVDALPTAFMKPLSGGGARAMMVETMRRFGADSFAGRMASVIQGSSETTFYVLAVYFGAVGIRRPRHALWCALVADLAGIVAAVLASYVFFGSPVAR